MNNLSFSLFPNENFLDLRLYQYGWEQCAPLHSFGPFIRNHFLFHYVISGQGVLDSTPKNGVTNRYYLEENQGFLICPGQVNTYSASEKHPWKYVWLEFDGLRASEHLSSAGLDISQPLYRPKTPAMGEAVRDLMLYIADHSESSSRILCHPPGVWRSTAPGFLYPGGDHLHRAELPARSDSGGDCGCLQTQPQLFQQAVQREHGLSPAGISDPDALDQSHRADEDQQRTDRGNFNRMRLSEPAALFPGIQKAVRHLPQGVAHPEQTPLERLTALRSASFLYVTRLSDGAGTADSRLSAWAEDIPPASAHPRDRPLPRHSPGSRRTDQAP